MELEVHYQMVHRNKYRHPTICGMVHKNIMSSIDNAAAAPAPAGASSQEPSPRRAKEIFGDCALVEIIHLHDCFRGALKNLEVDVSELCREMSSDGSGSETRISDLERRVAGRFTVIWSVFRAHSAAEDEFIWPALKAKQVSLPDDACGCDYASAGQPRPASFPPLPPPPRHHQQQQAAPPGYNDPVELLQGGAALAGQGNHGEPQQQQQQQRERAHSVTVHRIEQEEYEEDHADEERMFTAISGLLSNLRDELSNRTKAQTAAAVATASSRKGGPNVIPPTNNNIISPTLRNLGQMLLEGTRNMVRHLMTHLDKEETHCMPLVAQYLTKAEINDLVGKIMGKRSSELMSQILTMAIQNLNEADRDDMVHYMKQAMVGTFFERWLKMGGWMDKTSVRLEGSHDGGGKMPRGEDVEERKALATTAVKRGDENDAKLAAPLEEFLNEITDQPHPSSVRPNAAASASFASTSNYSDEEVTEKYTSAAELEKLIRAIGTNPHLDAKQKNLTIQGLRDSVWKSNCRLSKRKREAVMDATASEQPATHMARCHAAPAAGASSAQVVSGGHVSMSHQVRYAQMSSCTGALISPSRCHRTNTNLS